MFRFLFLHSRNSTENTYFRKELSVSLFSDVSDSFNSSVGRCNNFIQGTGVLLIINFVLIQLRSMEVLHSGLFVTKKALIVSIYMGDRLKPFVEVMFCTAKLNNKTFGLFKKLGNGRPRLRPCQIWSIFFAIFTI